MEPKTVCSVLLLCFAVTSAAETSSSTSNLRTLITDRFSSPRHHVTGKDAKDAARSYFYNTMQGYGMQVFMDSFLLSDRRVEAHNVLALWSGRQSNTPNDRPILLAAHYDTRRNSPGVVDNGSGMAALMEAARVIASQPCMQEFTVGFVAFDFWEQENREKNPGSACYQFGCGSREWVTNSFMPYLEHSALPPSSFEGVVVLDGVMNYNNTPGSQRVPNAEIYKVTDGVKEIYNSLERDNFRGNFITSVARTEYDESLYTKFQEKWQELGNPQYKQYNALIPLKDVETDGPKDPHWPVYRFLSYSDVWSFWKDNPDLKTMLLSDTALLRGRMQKCYHKGCDDISFLTPENMGLLKKTTDAVIKLALEVSRNGMSCRDPRTTAPAGFKVGLTMVGGFKIGQEEVEFNLVLDGFQASGAVHMIVGNDDMSLKDALSGRYDSETQQLTLRLSEPLNILKEQDPFVRTNWRMIGQVKATDTGVEWSGTFYDLLKKGHNEPFTFSTPKETKPQSGSSAAMATVFQTLACVVLAYVLHP